MAHIAALCKIGANLQKHWLAEKIYMLFFNILLKLARFGI